MNKRIPIVAVAAAVAVGAVAWWTWGRTPDAGSGLTLYGNVDIREVELAFRQPGRIASMAVDEGTEVRRGETVAEIDAKPYREALAAADAAVAQARAELEKLRRGNRRQDIERARATVTQAEAALQRLDADLKRQTALAATGAASEKNLQAVRAARAEAAAALVSARQGLSLQKEGARREDIAAAEARVAAAEAARAQAQTALDDTRLQAPADGVVLARVREPGAMVGSRDAVYTLSLQQPVYVRAYVAEPQLGRVAPGTPVQVTTDSSRKVYRGQVGFVSPRAEFTPKTVETTELRTALVYRLRIVIPQADDGLRQGMPVTVHVDAERADKG